MGDRNGAVACGVTVRLRAELGTGERSAAGVGVWSGAGARFTGGTEERTGVGLTTGTVERRAVGRTGAGDGERRTTGAGDLSGTGARLSVGAGERTGAGTGTVCRTEVGATGTGRFD